MGDWSVHSLLIAEDRDLLLARIRGELLRVLRPGGSLVVFTGLGGTSEDPLEFLLPSEDHTGSSMLEERISCGHLTWSDFQTQGFGGLQQNYRCHCLIRS